MLKKEKERKRERERERERMKNNVRVDGGPLTEPRLVLVRPSLVSLVSNLAVREKRESALEGSSRPVELFPAAVLFLSWSMSPEPRRHHLNVPLRSVRAAGF